MTVVAPPHDLAGTPIDRNPRAAPAPIVNRFTVIAAAAASLAALLVSGVTYGGSDRGTGILGAVAAAGIGVAVVSGVVAWVGGLVLCLRSGSLVGILVLLLFPLVIGPIAAALWSPPPSPPGASPR